MRTDRPIVVQEGPDALLAIRVQPRASRNQLVAQSPDGLTLRLTAPPVEGAANAACCAFLAELLDLPKSRVVLARGEASRHKLLRIRDVDAAEVLARLQSLTGPPERK
ncbi:MAG TPA: DUF167 domain-containing protein [Candidatus Methylomirabilis sp.]|nr:DUF167 domain-containing protein [Candidatus Methylomirabilis sp.]HSB80970.1 DUF167 domain-containing protein [Candidatus Methylomirabilis sp.]